MSEDNKFLRNRLEFFEEKSLPLGHCSDQCLPLGYCSDQNESIFDFKILYMDENAIVLSDNSGLWIIDRIEFKVIAY